MNKFEYRLVDNEFQGKYGTGNHCKCWSDCGGRQRYILREIWFFKEFRNADVHREVMKYAIYILSVLRNKTYQ